MQSLKDTQIKYIKKKKTIIKTKFLNTGPLRAVLTCHIEGAFLGRGDGAVSTAQQRTAPPFAHLLLQPGTQLQVGLRG